MKVTKAAISYIIFTIAICYIISPWFFEKKLLFNELLSAIGIGLLIYKQFHVGRDRLSILMTLLISWGLVHAVTSLFRMDHIYYYLRNMVILYSMFAFFIGYYLLKYLNDFINRTRTFLRVYIITLLFVPIHFYLFERFSTATIFPALFKNIRSALVPVLLLVMIMIYSVTYESSTSIILAAFFFFLFISPGYRFFKQVTLLMVGTFALIFVYLRPNLDLISINYSYYSYKSIYRVINSHPILSVDGNSTWRMVFWKQIIFDHFPANIFGLGYGTPMMKYFPIEDFSKLPTLPYVFGAHNSYIYLFGRLGIVYLLLIVPIYAIVFKEYFYYKKYYKQNDQILLFWSFFAISVISLFNPTLESPIYAAGYWLLLGFVARCIHNRIYGVAKQATPEVSPDTLIQSTAG